MSSTDAETKGKKATEAGLIRVKDSDKRFLESMTKQSNEPMWKVVHKILIAYRKNQYFEKLNASYAALRADPVAWKEEQDERELWDSTVADGLTDA